MNRINETTVVLISIELIFLSTSAYIGFSVIDWTSIALVFYNLNQSINRAPIKEGW